MSTFANPPIYQTALNSPITAAGGSVILTVPQASANAFIMVTGTFSGDLSFQGSNDNTIWNGHRAYKTGVGPIGVSTITYPTPAIAINSEYRIISGDRYLRVISGSNFSGTANITITTTPYADTVFVNGAVHNAQEEALRAGKKFNFSSSNQTATGNGSMGMFISNPTTSLVNLAIHKVVLSTSSSTITLPYQVYRNPTNTGTGFTSLTASNAKIGSTNTSSAVAGYILSTTATPFSGGTNGSSGYINAGEKDITNDVFLTPGQILGYIISAPTGGFAASSGVNCTIYFYEETAF